MADQIWGNLASLQMLFVQLLGAVYICQPETLMPYQSRCQFKCACRYAIECRHEIGHVARRPLLRLLSWLCFYQTRSAWSMDQGSTKKRSAVHNFVPIVTNFCVMWEGLSFGNYRGEIVDRRMVFIWSLIHGSGYSRLIKAEPGARSCGQVDTAHLKIGYPGMKYTCTRTRNHLQQLDYKIGPPNCNLSRWRHDDMHLGYLCSKVLTSHVWGFTFSATVSVPVALSYKLLYYIGLR